MHSGLQPREERAITMGAFTETTSNEQADFREALLRAWKPAPKRALFNVTAKSLRAMSTGELEERVLACRRLAVSPSREDRLTADDWRAIDRMRSIIRSRGKGSTR
jgi:hypothetical protein